MPKLDLSLASNPDLILIAILAGMVPALLWLFFWLREDRDHPEPRGLIFMTFVAGMLVVIFVLPVEKFIAAFPFTSVTKTVLWAAAEELFKYGAFLAILFHNQYLDEPIDYPIYLITAGLGFAALENTLFILHPLQARDMTVSLLTGNMRFLGATLLHSASGALIGISLGLTYFQPKFIRYAAGLVGFAAAVALHSVFNFFIIQKNGENFLQVFGFLWVVTIIIMLLFEKLRRMGSYKETALRV
jgi:RsiW-degrading membrane proteinase PrsW (M82 family)